MLDCFDSLRNLANTLDWSLGVEMRKIILEDNERLTLKTDRGEWMRWIFSVTKRFDTMVDEKNKRRIKIENFFCNLAS